MLPVLSRLQSQGHSYIQDESDTRGIDILEAKRVSVKKAAKNELSDPNKLIICGYLHKKSQRYHNYKRRWFNLRNCQLSYYKDETEHKPLGVIQGMNLLSVNVDDVESHHHKNKFYFKVHTNDKVLQLYADDSKVLKDWIKGLKELIEFNCNDGGIAASEDSSNDDSNHAEEHRTIQNNPNKSTTDTSKRNNSARNSLLVPPQGFPDHNSSVEFFSGLDDLNYTSNASDSNSQPLPQTTSAAQMQQQQLPSLPPIKENKKMVSPKVSLEREKLTTRLLNRRFSDGSSVAQETGGANIGLLLDEILDPKCEQEIIIEKGLMSRLYKRYNQWKKFFIILTNKNLLFYKYNNVFNSRPMQDILKVEKPSKVIKVEHLLDIVELDALSKSKQWCFLLITKDKRLRFCVDDEEELVKWLVAITMLTKRRKDEAEL